LNLGGTTLSGVTLGDDVTLDTSSATGAFDDKNFGTAKTVTVSGLALSGTNAGNYTLTQPTATASIAAKNLAVTDVAANDKVYDGTVVTTLSGTPTLSGVVSGDTVILGGTASATFADKLVGGGKPVTTSGYSISGADSSNYALSQPLGLAANITARPLTVSATASSKVYDGTTAATATLSDDRLLGDSLATSYSAAAFADRFAGNGKTVTVSGISVIGIDSGNYTFNTTATTLADITPKPLTITANDTTKMYGQALTFAGNELTSSGLVNPDLITGVTLTSNGADAAAPEGTYAIVPSNAGGFGLINYTITYLNGTLTVTSAIPQITGQVELESFVGSGTTPSYTRTVTFVATGGTYISTWVMTLTNTTGAVFDFALTDVPPGTTAISAKTDWNLRRKLSVTFDSNNQATAYFTGSLKLLGGDLNDDNVVDSNDSDILASNWGQTTTGTTADINGDGVVDQTDDSILQTNLGATGDPE
jgi:hypothetical protein